MTAETITTEKHRELVYQIFHNITKDLIDATIAKAGADENEEQFIGAKKVLRFLREKHYDNSPMRNWTSPRDKFPDAIMY